MDELEAAIRILEEDGGALHWTVIQDRALRQGLLDPFETPDIRKKLISALSAAARAREGRIVKVDRGVYRAR
jgi:hypothetical protein